MLNIFTSQKVRSRMESGPMGLTYPRLRQNSSSRVTPGAPFVDISELPIILVLGLSNTAYRSRTSVSRLSIIISKG